MKQVLWSLVALPFVLGCAFEQMDDEAGSTSFDLELAEAEIQRHHDAVMHASDPAQVATEAAEHDRRMHGILDELHEPTSRAGHCHHAGQDPMQGMVESMDRMQSEHLNELHVLGSLSALREACSAYVDDTHALLRAMHQAQADESCMH